MAVSFLIINITLFEKEADVLKDIVSAKWQIVVISPEMMLSKRFTKYVLRNPEMRERVLSVVIDEAHVVSHWGSGF